MAKLKGISMEDFVKSRFTGGGIKTSEYLLGILNFAVKVNGLVIDAAETQTIFHVK